MVKWINPLTHDQKSDWQLVKIKSKSGATISGLFATSLSEKAKATIVLGHPMGKEAKGYFLKNGYTELLRENGFNTFIFDFNGFGESTNGNFSYHEDITAAGIEASRLAPNIPVGYFGISLGGQWATISLTDSNHKYEFAIIESASTSLDEFWIQFPGAYKVLSVLNLFLPEYRRKIHMIERIKEIRNIKSILLIYSKTDHLTPYEMGKRYMTNSPVSTELWAVEDANHAAIMKSDHHTAYRNKIIEYLNKCTETQF